MATLFKEINGYVFEELPKHLCTRLTCDRLIEAPCGYSQWKGRAICFIKCLQTLVREPWRMLKQSLGIPLTLLAVIHELFNMSLKKSFSISIGTLLFVGSLLMRPIIMIKEFGQYGFGAIIHPKFVIETISPFEN